MLIKNFIFCFREKIWKHFTDTEPYDFFLASGSMENTVPECLIQCSVTRDQQMLEKLRSDIFSHTYLHPNENKSEEVIILGKTDEW